MSFLALIDISFNALFRLPLRLTLPTCYALIIEAMYEFAHVGPKEMLMQCV